MQYPKDLENEKERLEALHTYDLLNQVQNSEFDEIVEFAAFVCNTPISLISIVESDQQRFLGNHGLPVGSTARSVSFCAHAIHDIHQPLLVEDATKDVRFRDNPLVTGVPNIVFYAGYPLYTSDDIPIGTLCVIDRKPKILSERQKQALNLLSKQVMRLFELRKSVKEAANRELVLEQGIKGLEESTAIVTHDLKTSLRNIEISTELLVKKNADRLDEHCKEYIENIQKETSESIRFINDILKYSRSTYVFTINNSLVNIPQLLEEIFNKLKVPTHFEVKLADHLPAIYTSPSIIQHIFENLIQNSIKYMDKEQAVIEIDYSLEKENYHTFKVKDNGSGIPKSKQEAIFTIFNRAQRKEEHNSFGVGLATVHRLITLLGGSIEVDSEVGKGANFIFKIPIEVVDTPTL